MYCTSDNVSYDLKTWPYPSDTRNHGPMTVPRVGETCYTYVCAAEDAKNFFFYFPKQWACQRKYVMIGITGPESMFH